VEITSHYKDLFYIHHGISISHLLRDLWYTPWRPLLHILKISTSHSGDINFTFLTLLLDTLDISISDLGDLYYTPGDFYSIFWKPLLHTLEISTSHSRDLYFTLWRSLLHTLEISTSHSEDLSILLTRFYSNIRIDRFVNAICLIEIQTKPAQNLIHYKQVLLQNLLSKIKNGYFFNIYFRFCWKRGFKMMMIWSLSQRYIFYYHKLSIWIFKNNIIVYQDK
jgi:hypothetical protein